MHAQRKRLPSSLPVSSAAPAILVRDLRKAYGDHRGRARARLRGRAGRGLRPARTQRRRQDDDRRDPRGLPHPDERHRLGARPRPAAALARAARAGRHRAAEHRHVPPHHGARGDRATGPASTRARATSTRSSTLAGLREKADAYTRTLSRRPAAPAGLRARARRRPGADLPRRADDRLRPRGAARGVGRRSARCRTSARRSCSRRTTSTRRRRSATASRSSRRGGSSPRAPPASSAPASTRYRVTWRDEDGDAPDARDRRPDRAAAPAHERGARARRRRCATSPSRRPSLEDVYLELTAEASRPATRRPPRPRRRPPVAEAAALTWRQYRLERRMFWRNPTAAFFNFVLPLLFLALFGAIFSRQPEEPRRHRPGHRRHERSCRRRSARWR